MPQTFGTSLKSFLHDKQAAVAQRWLELWEKRVGAVPEWKLDTVVSHLSRALNDKGMTFFTDPERMKVLFDALEVPEAARAGLRHIAEQATREPSPRLVVDITHWPDKGEAVDALFNELREKVFAGPKLVPALLVLTDNQFDRLPRSFDELVEVHRVRAAEDGVAKTCELAGESALVLAPWQVDPLGRWLAGHFDGQKLSLEPADGLGVFAEHERLLGVPEVAHALADITAASSSPIRDDRLTSTMRRRWIHALADEAALATLLPGSPELQTPAARLAFAQQLGAAATSMASERLAHELDQLATAVTEASGLPVETLSAAAHAQILARAEQRPSGPKAWRQGDEIHLLGLTPPHDHPRLVTHTPTPPEPAISRLLAHVADWTADDYDSDPTLLRAIVRMAPADQHKPLLHARSTILWNGLLPPRQPAKRANDWEAALRELLIADPPAASLRLSEPPPPEPSKNGRLTFFTVQDETLTAIMAKASPEIQNTPGCTNLLLSRGQTAQRVAVHKGIERLTVKGHDQFKLFDGDGNYRMAWHQVPTVWLPALTPGNHVDLCMDHEERSAWVGGWKWDDGERCQTLLRGCGDGRISLVKIQEAAKSNLVVDDETWDEADLVLAQCWMALRAAMSHLLAVRLHTGAVVLSLGGGMSASIEVSERRGAVHGEAAGTVTAALAAELESRPSDVSVKLAYASLWTHDAKVGSYEAQLGIRVPVHLTLRGPHVRADVRFFASQLLQAVPVAQLAPLAAIAAKIVDDEEAQAWDDD